MAGNMQHPITDFLRSALIPELCTDVTTGPPRNRETVLVTVATVWAFPYELSALIFDNLNLTVVAAGLSVITLCIQLRIHDIFINKFHD